ncbi:thiol reductant ABC exporter subunit CydD [Corticibacter populi]|uniref:Thiol reductant ABC exporter subunit CydD n=1 Tax=Corticibacter populi TaxID=1550736 RepID=A0A3M6QZ81_9BURK|nr:thiol reductant ABC exporter subunit CydD [Corticibacter populi]RMX08265.1 thiol reductant ABC exporter subunit CydD [Corticibacter populi]RZS35542.1 ATP-binding cassette subfamily C protein CydD [Corticibacter populi]
MPSPHAVDKALSVPELPSLLHGVAAWPWVAQAWLLAGAVAALAADAATIHWSGALQAALGIVLIGMLRASLEYWSSRRSQLQARTHLTQLRQQASLALQVQSPLDQRRPASGALTSAWVEQAEAIVPWLSRYRNAQWRVLLAPPLILLCVAWHSWLAALVLLLAAPMIPLFMAIVGWRAQAISAAQMVELGQMHGFLLDRLRGLATLRAMDAVGATARRLRERGLDLAARSMRVLRVAFLSSAVLELFAALGVALVAVYVGFHLLGQLPFGTWGGPLDLRAGLFILLLAPSFFEPLRELSAVWHDRANGLAGAQSLAGLSTPLTPLVLGKPQMQVTPQGQPMPALSVEFRQVELVMPDALAPLPRLDGFIPAGAHVAITGASGSGKSLVLALVAGLLRPQTGEVRIDGQAMDEAHAAGLRQRIGWMGQQPHIFAASAWRNITLGRPQIDHADLRATLQATGLAGEVTALTETPLGEGGAGISGGEAVRLMLARLAAQQSAGLLLLDEPTAHLDAETASQVISAIETLAEGRTLLVATHDPQLIARLPLRIAIDADSARFETATGGIVGKREEAP